MSLFKSQLFTDEPRRLVLDLGNEADAFGPTYGNPIANERQFRERWDGRCKEPPSPAVDIP